MKIIYSDNIPTDMSSETLWLDGLPDDVILMERLCDRLNRGLGDYPGNFYRAVPDDHKLYKFEY